MPTDKPEFNLNWYKYLPVQSNFNFLRTFFTDTLTVNSEGFMPSLTGAYDTPGGAYRVQVVGNLAYVADFDSGLQILNITNPAAPTLIGSYDTPGTTKGVELVGLNAFVADESTEVQIIDVSESDNNLISDSDNNTINGGAGTNTLDGGSGDDTYIYCFNGWKFSY